MTVNIYQFNSLLTFMHTGPLTTLWLLKKNSSKKCACLCHGLMQHCPAVDSRTLGRKTRCPCSAELYPAANTPPCMHNKWVYLGECWEGASVWAGPRRNATPRHHLHSTIDVALYRDFVSFVLVGLQFLFADLISHVLESY